MFSSKLAFLMNHILIYKSKSIRLKDSKHWRSDLFSSKCHKSILNTYNFRWLGTSGTWDNGQPFLYPGGGSRRVYKMPKDGCLHWKTSVVLVLASQYSHFLQIQAESKYKRTDIMYFVDLASTYSFHSCVCVNVHSYMWICIYGYTLT